ncbi:MAG: hypothetical protein AB7N76_26650 [Planctomycetota bacterium]
MDPSANGLYLPPTFGSAIVSADSFLDDVTWFRSLLTARGVRLNDVSYFNRCLTDLEDYARRTAARRVESEKLDAPTFLREAISAGYLVRTLRRAERRDAASWEAIADHWLPIFTGSDVGLIEFRPTKNNDARNTAWEALTAALLAEFATDVRPGEPDIVMQYRGGTFGVACKVLHSDKPEKHIHRIVEGAKQLEGSACETGLVLVNVSALLDHGAFFQVAGADPDGVTRYLGLSSPDHIEELKRQIDRIADAFTTKSMLERVTFDRKTGLPRNKTLAIGVVAQTVAGLHGAVPAVFTVVKPIRCRRIETVEEDFLTRLNHGAQTAFTYRPSVPPIVILPK